MLTLFELSNSFLLDFYKLYKERLHICFATMKFLATALGFASVASAHTLFTNLFVDGKNQGDGTCVRQPSDGSTATSPIYPVTGDVMACGMAPPFSPIWFNLTNAF